MSPSSGLGTSRGRSYHLAPSDSETSPGLRESRWPLASLYVRRLPPPLGRRHSTWYLLKGCYLQGECYRLGIDHHVQDLVPAGCIVCSSPTVRKQPPTEVHETHHTQRELPRHVSSDQEEVNNSLVSGSPRLHERTRPTTSSMTRVSHLPGRKYL